MKRILLAISVILFAGKVEAQWEQVHGTIMDTAWLADIAVSENYLWAATVWDGFWRQDKHTGEWIKIFSLPLDSSFIQDLATQGENIFVLDNQYQLFGSTDLGNSWNKITPQGILLGFTEITVDDTIVLLGGNIEFEYSGLRITSDTGKTWSASTILIDDELFFPATYARTSQAIFMGEHERIFRSTDNNQTWEELINGPKMEPGCLHCEITQLFASGDLVWAVEMNDYYHSTRLHVSSDVGDNWDIVNLGLNDSGFFAGFNYFLAINEILLATKTVIQNNGVYVSFDHGQTGILFNDGLTATMDARKMTADDEYIYLATGGSGVWRRKIEDLYTTSISDYGMESNQISVYPNPSNGNFRLHLEPAIASEGQLKITDIHGHIHLSDKIQNLAFTEIHAPYLIPGIYFVSFQTTSGIYTGKLMVQK